MRGPGENRQEKVGEWHKGTSCHWEKKVEAKLAEFRAAGQPVTWEEVLAAREQIPDDENSALILLEALDQLQSVERRYAWDFVYAYRKPCGAGVRHSEPLRDTVLQYLEAKAQALRLIHHAAALPGGSFPVGPLADPLDLDQRHLPPLREAGRVLAVDAACNAEIGDSTKSARSLVTGLRLARCLRDWPSSIGLLVGVATDSICLSALERCLEVCEFSVDDLQALRRELDREDRELTSIFALYGDRAVGNDYFERKLAGSSAQLGRFIPGWPEAPVFRYNERVGRVIDICSLPVWQRLDHMRALEGATQPKGKIGPFLRVLDDTFVPRYSRVVESEVKLHARLRVARAALAVEEWRLRHGTWPDSLQQLVPGIIEAFPQDAFSGEPIRYRKTANGIVVYSVGMDGEDNGGLSEYEALEPLSPDEEEPEAWDLPFRLLNPELRGAATLTFREEIMDSWLNLRDLEEAGFTEEKLLELGFTQEDLQELEGRR